MKRGLLLVFAGVDWARWLWKLLSSRVRLLYDATPNAVDPLQLAHQCVLDAIDSMEAIHAALKDRDYDEARHLAALAHDSLLEHEQQLKGIM